MSVDQITVTDPVRFARLPQWAQEHIRTLEREVLRERTRGDNAMLAATAAADGTHTFVRPGDMRAEMIPVDKYADIVFRTGPRRHEIVSARVARGGTGPHWLELATGEGPILLQGVSSNRILVRADPNWGS